MAMSNEQRIKNGRWRLRSSKVLATSTQVHECSRTHLLLLGLTDQTRLHTLDAFLNHLRKNSHHPFGLLARHAVLLETLDEEVGVEVGGGGGWGWAEATPRGEGKGNGMRARTKGCGEVSPVGRRSDRQRRSGAGQVDRMHVPRQSAAPAREVDGCDKSADIDMALASEGTRKRNRFNGGLSIATRRHSDSSVGERGNHVT
jgi:hypothetical protein